MNIFTEGDTDISTPILSPSKITQYFGPKRSRRKGANKQEKSDPGPVVTDTVYLTPESSPGSAEDLNSRRESECEDTPPSPDVLKLHTPLSPDLVKQHTPLSPDLVKLHISESDNIDAPHNLVDKMDSYLCNGYEHSVDEKHQEDDNDAQVTSCSSCQENQSESSDKSNGTTSELSTAQHQGPVTRRATSPVKSKKNILERSVDSPSVPRSKLRKNTGTAPAVLETTKPKPGRRKKNHVIQTNTITDYFPIRRSGRQTKSEIEREKKSLLEKLILMKCEDGLEVKVFENKGRGIVATKDFEKGDFVVEYSGDLLDIPTARAKELEYGKNPDIGCYMYFFKCSAKQYCVDATSESDCVGRLINHSRDGNCCTRSLMLNDIPRLILVASRNIKSGEELSYDYGDRSKAALEAHPWLKL